MIWRKKRESTDSATASHPTAESGQVQAGAGTSEEVAGRVANGNSPSNSDRLTANSVRSQQDFQPTPGVYASQRKYAIPRSYRVWGRVVSSRPIHIQGEVVEGELVSQMVCVLPGGAVRAKTQADTVQVAGVVEGDIQARLVDVASLGELRGAVTASELRVLPGAKLSGANLAIGQS
jgi:cytoskeletal protein CcmA (bactofilin family)